MKKIILLLFVALSLLSCVDNSTTFPPEAEGVYYGNLTVGDFTERVGISVTETSDSTVEVFFDNVRFSERMPLKIDITVKGVPCQKNGEILTFSAANIDPYVNRSKKPNPDYRFTTLRGVVEGDELLLEAMMDEGLRETLAGKEFAFKGICNRKQ